MFVFAAQNCLNPQCSVPPSGSAFYDPGRSIGLFAKVVNNSSSCCAAPPLQLIEFSLTPASTNRPAALIKKQVKHAALTQQHLRCCSLKNRTLEPAACVQRLTTHGPIRFVTKRLKAHGPQRLANKELNTWPKLNNEELFLFPTNSRMS